MPVRLAICSRNKLMADGTTVVNKSSLAALQVRLGYQFVNPALLARALTHVSFERQKSEGHNEVLEFLGDAVLDLAISDLLIQFNPQRDEGDLSRMRASLVNAAVLAEKAISLGLGALLRIGKGEEKSEGRSKPSILAGAFEAVLGAVYQEGGYQPARQLVERFFFSDLSSRGLAQQDYKTRLQEISQMLFHEPPSYRLLAEKGPDHNKSFVTEISVGGKVLGQGEGRSKKQSEQQAAKQALAILQSGNGETDYQ